MSTSLFLYRQTAFSSFIQLFFVFFTGKLFFLYHQPFFCFRLFSLFFFLSRQQDFFFFVRQVSHPLFILFSLFFGLPTFISLTSDSFFFYDCSVNQVFQSLICRLAFFRLPLVRLLVYFSDHSFFRLLLAIFFPFLSFSLIFVNSP